MQIVFKNIEKADSRVSYVSLVWFLNGVMVCFTAMFRLSSRGSTMHQTLESPHKHAHSESAPALTISP